MNQTEINAMWQRSCGIATILIPPLREVPGLRKPYQFIVSFDAVNALKRTLRELERKYAPYVQHGGASWKPLKYGTRLDVFILAHAPGYCGDPLRGVTQSEWSIVVEELRNAIQGALGTEIPMYVEEWRPINKFQARYETYIKYAET